MTAPAAQKEDTPDTPPEVLANQGKSRALTRETAELIGSKTVLDDKGHLHDGYTQAVAANAAAVKARRLAEAYVGGTPVAGLTPARVAAIKGKNYKDAPKQDPELGDRTSAFVNWLYAHHPGDAKVRYAYRDIWPTALPKDWPPKVVVKKKPVAKPIAPITPNL